MKRFLTILFIGAVIGALLFTGCGSNEGTSPQAMSTEESDRPVSSGSETGNSEEPVKPEGLIVGFSRVDVTPAGSVPLQGFGNTTSRMSNGFLDPIYVTCIALTDVNGDTLLWYTMDLCQNNNKVMAEVVPEISKATSVPEDHIITTATHTHSSVDQSQTQLETVRAFNEKFSQGMIRAAMEALSDQKPAVMKWKELDLTGYNFVRHYVTDKEGDPTVGDNHGDLHEGEIVRHISEANHTMYLLAFCRENAKDVIVANWRAHATLTAAGGNARKDVSADFIGTVRYYLEKDEDVLFAYMQGDAGNINPKTRLSDDQEKNPPSDYKEYGQEIADKIASSLGEMEEIEPGPIKTVRTALTCRVNHSTDAYKSVAKGLYDFWVGGGATSALVERGREYGIDSPYEASAIVSRASMGETADLDIRATLIGDFALVNAPVEIFDTNGDYVRENSPVRHTFVSGYSNASSGYMPSQAAFGYGCYEADTTRFVAGTGEILASKLTELLNSLK